MVSFFSCACATNKSALIDALIMIVTSIVTTYMNIIREYISRRWLTSDRVVKFKSDRGDSWLALNGEDYTLVPAFLSTYIFLCWRYRQPKTLFRCHRRFRWTSTASVFHLHTEKDSPSFRKGKRLTGNCLVHKLIL